MKLNHTAVISPKVIDLFSEKEQQNRSPHDIGMLDASVARTRPERSPAELEALIRSLGVAMFTEREAVVTVWGSCEDQTFTGKITQLDKIHKTIRVESKAEYTWIPFDDVLGIDIVIEPARQ